MQLWERSLTAIAAASSTSAQVVGDRIRTAELAVVQLMRPDGVLEAIGDGNESLIDPAKLRVDTAQAPTRLWCMGRGWAANRSSWDDTATHHTLRFGPRRTFHGHYDHGSLTWFTQGVPVFSDRGLFDKSKGQRYQWAQSRDAHTVLEAHRARPRGSTKARDVSDDTVDRYVVSWHDEALASTRDISIPLQPVMLPTAVDDTAMLPAPATSLRVQDVGTARFDQQWFQHWQLAPGWTVLDRSTAWEPAAFHEESGLYLYGTCRSGMDMRMMPRPVESFPSWRAAVPATAFTCGGLGRRVELDTLWVVTPIRGLLSRDRETEAFAVTPTPAG